MKDGTMVQLLLEQGTVVHVQGIPVLLEYDTAVSGTAENLARMLRSIAAERAERAEAHGN